MAELEQKAFFNLHVALKTATELNIEIGIFNSPGWSQSGGPWIKPEEAMRYRFVWSGAGFKCKILNDSGGV